MNLTKALKHKKKLAKQADEFYVRFQKYNSHNIERASDYSAEEMYTAWMTTISKLVDLKARIQIANGPIQHKIFRMAEIKGLVSRLRNIETREGTFTESSYTGTVSKTYEAFLNTVKKDQLVSDLESELETLQDEIEAFNAITKI
jgi:hypothetical protein